MSLLVDLSVDALDPGYAQAAARRRGDRSPGARRRVPLVAGVLAATLVLVVAAVQARVHAPAAGRSRAALVAAVDRQTRAVTALEAEVSRLRAQAAALRDRSLAGTSVGAALAAQVRAGELAAGTIAVTGPGMRVVLDDERGGGGEHNQVQDRDLQSVVNALWGAGAEAVAINGQRLTGQSAIRQAGQAILVDLTPVDPPYVVEAVGDPVRMETGFAASPAASRMRGYAQLYGLGFRYTRVKALRLPAAAEEPLRYARPLPSPSPRSSSP